MNTGQKKKRMVLVVDDDPNVLDLVTAELDSKDFCVVRLERGQDAVDYLRKTKFDLVILDVVLPDLNGEKVTKNIRQRYSEEELPILILSAYFRADKDPKDLLERWRVQGFLSKPIQRGQIRKAVYPLLSLQIVNDLPPKRDDQELQESYFEKLKDTAKNLSDVVDLGDGSELSEHSLKEIALQAHRIFGTAASFGFHEQGKIAQKIENLARGLIETGTDQGSQELKRLRYLAGYLERSVMQKSGDASSRSQSSHDEPLLYLGRDEVFLARLKEDTKKSPLRVHSMASDADALRGLRSKAYTMLIIDTDFFNETPFDLVRGAKSLSASRGLKVICVGSRDDLSLRKELSKARVEHYWLKDQASKKILERYLEKDRKEEKTILFMDDDPFMQKYMKANLSSSSWRVECGSKPNQVVEKAKALQPDLIILDFEMPGMKGYELCRILKLDDSVSHIPVMIFSAHDEEEYRLRSLDSGAIAYLKKGMSPRELKLNIESIFKQYQSMSRKSVATDERQEDAAGKKTQIPPARLKGVNQ